MTYLEATFTIYQFGFLPGRSPIQQPLLFTESLLKSEVKHEEVDVIYVYGLQKSCLTQWASYLPS